ncbi:MAG: hypothetical protein H5T45_07580 [Thermoplasmatales archaeon]|nr:hypothetical protein [Thermoplasmatales archaeon]
MVWGMLSYTGPFDFLGAPKKGNPPKMKSWQRGLDGGVLFPPTKSRRRGKIGREATLILAVVMLGVVMAGCLAPSYSVYDSGKIRFEYPSDYEVITNNTEDVQADHVGVDLFVAGVAFNDTSDPDHESVAVTRYDDMTLDEAIDIDTGAAVAEDESLEELENGISEGGMDVLWKGEYKRRPAALLSNIYSVPELQLWELNIQDGKSVYTIYFWTHSIEWKNTTLGGETFEVPKNFAHIIETLNFH